MKTKYLLLAMVALLVLGGLWFARAAWRAHHQIVTLDVYNVPLAEVLRKVEWQTWRKIRAEKNLDARITLHVTGKPLSYVLDRLAEQAGAHWSTLYAVYRSRRALKTLDSALRADGKLDPVGWAKLAPKPQISMPPDPGESGAPPRIMINPNSSGPDAGAPGLVLGTGPDPGSSLPPTGQPGSAMFFRRTPNGVMVTQDASGQMEVWSPEELVMESALNDQLGGEHYEDATAAAAAEAARKVNGKWTTYLAFRKSIVGVGFGGPPTGRPGLPAKHNPNDRFTRLTPEQRVERARNRMGLEPK